jgi:hypothetical protein
VEFGPGSVGRFHSTSTRTDRAAARTPRHSDSRRARIGTCDRRLRRRLSRAQGHGGVGALSPWLFRRRIGRRAVRACGRGRSDALADERRGRELHAGTRRDRSGKPLRRGAFVARPAILSRIAKQGAGRRKGPGTTPRRSQGGRRGRAGGWTTRSVRREGGPNDAVVHRRHRGAPARDRRARACGARWLARQPFGREGRRRGRLGHAPSPDSRRRGAALDVSRSQVACQRATPCG